MALDVRGVLVVVTPAATPVLAQQVVPDAVDGGDLSAWSTAVP